MDTKRHAPNDQYWGAEEAVAAVPRSSPPGYSEYYAETKPLTDPAQERCHYSIYLIFVIQGIAMLLPWNVFITASEYFITVFKGGHFAGNFQNYFSVSFMLFNMLFVIIAVARQHKANFARQIIISHILHALIFLVVMSLTLLAPLPPNTYFGVILSLMTLSAITTSYMQNALFALCAKLPPIYVQGFLTGQGLAGLLAAIVPLVIALVADPSIANSEQQVTERATIYFSFSACLAVLALLAYCILLRTDFYRRASTCAISTNGASTGLPMERYSFRAMLSLSRVVWRYSAAILLALLVTLALFPSITASIISTTANSSIWTSREVFVLLHFIIFNVGDMLGKMLPAILPVRDDRALLILSTLRVAFAPLFVFCNVQYGQQPLDGRSPTPVLFGDIPYYVILAVFAMSNGWIGSCVMMYGPRKVQDADRGYAAMLLSLWMTLGMTVGSLASFAVRHAICQCNPFLE